MQVTTYNICNGDSSCIRERILSTKNYDGAGGVFSISEEGVAVKKISFKQVQGGEFKEIK